ncbi:MAG: glycosyltransferase [Rhodocyclaceae bacterium]|nr:glycosyltransferase [Rhodocyclaceae bacterium]
MRGKNPQISVVIPSYKPGSIFTECLHSVVTQRIDVPYEVIVVDSSPKPIGSQFSSQFPQVQFVHLDRRALPGKARSIGAQMAKGDVVCFIDTDCIADPEWLKWLWEAQSQGYSVAGGSVLNGTPKSVIGTAEYLLEFNEFNPLAPARNVRALPSCNLSVHQQIFKRVGYFPDFMKGEDTIFCERVYALGESIRFVPQARILHMNRTGFSHFIKNQVALGEGAVECRRRTQRPGAFLTRMPPLLPLLPLYRTLAISRRLLGSDLKLFIRFIFLYPFIFLGLISHAWGFIRGPYRSKLSTEIRNS